MQWKKYKKVLAQVQTITKNRQSNEVVTYTNPMGSEVSRKSYQWAHRLTCNCDTHAVLRWAHSPRHFLSRRPCKMHDDVSRGWGGFLCTNYMPIYNQLCDTENEFTAWIPVIMAIRSSHRRVSIWLHLVGTSRIYGEKNKNKKEAVHKTQISTHYVKQL